MGTATEKPLMELAGKMMIEHVLDRLIGVRGLKGLICVTSTNTPKTTSFLRQVGYDVLVAAGLGYYEDLKAALEKLGPGLYVTFSADVPFLVPQVIDGLLVRHSAGDLADRNYVVVVVSEHLAKSVGVPLRSVTRFSHEGKHYFPTGIRMIRYGAVPVGEVLSDPFFVTVEEPRLAINVNTLEDLRVAELVARSL